MALIARKVENLRATKNGDGTETILWTVPATYKLADPEKSMELIEDQPARDREIVQPLVVKEIV